MRARALLLACGLLAAPLAACDGEDPVDAALRDASAARHAANVQTTAEVEASPTTTTDPDRAAAAQLIAGHRAAITSAERQLAGVTDPELRGLTEAGIAARRREVSALEGWLSDTD